MSTLYLMVGMPGMGKSTYAKTYIDDHDVYICSDEIIEQEARIVGKTYRDVFKDIIGPAQKICLARAKLAFMADKVVVWDNTNLTVKSRASKLAMVPKHYKKVAIVVWCHDEVEHNRRLNNRPGKTIPDDVMKAMRESYVPPTYDEGFDGIFFIDT